MSAIKLFRRWFYQALAYRQILCLYFLLLLDSCQIKYCLNQNCTITKTRLYNFDPLKPHFYTVKLRFTGVYIIFFISAQNIDCGYSLEPPRWGGSNEYRQSMFWAEIWKISEFFIWKFSLVGGKIFSVFEQACFRNGSVWYYYPFVKSLGSQDFTRFLKLKIIYVRKRPYKANNLRPVYSTGGRWRYIPNLKSDINNIKLKITKFVEGF